MKALRLNFLPRVFKCFSLRLLDKVIKRMDVGAEMYFVFETV